MGMFISNRRVRHKQFDYEPRFYDSRKDEKLKQRMRVQRMTRKRGKPQGIIYFVMLFATVVYFYMHVG